MLAETWTSSTFSTDWGMSKAASRNQIVTMRRKPVARLPDRDRAEVAERRSDDRERLPHAPPEVEHVTA